MYTHLFVQNLDKKQTSTHVQMITDPEWMRFPYKTLLCIYVDAFDTCQSPAEFNHWAFTLIVLKRKLSYFAPGKIFKVTAPQIVHSNRIFSLDERILLTWSKISYGYKQNLMQVTGKILAFIHSR